MSDPLGPVYREQQVVGAIVLAIFCMFIGFLWWVVSPMADLWLGPHVKLEGLPPIKLQEYGDCKVLTRWDTTVRIYASQGRLVARCEGPALKKEQE